MEVSKRRRDCSVPWRTRHVRGLNSEEKYGYAKRILGAALDVLPGGIAGLGPRDTRQHQRRHFRTRRESFPVRPSRSPTSKTARRSRSSRMRRATSKRRCCSLDRIVSSVEMPNFKTLNQDVMLSVAQTLSVSLTLEVGNVSETVNVTAEAPILDTTSVSSGQNFDRALIEGLPMAANQPILLSKFAQGIVGPTTQQIVLQGQIDGPNDGAGDPRRRRRQLQLLDRRRDQRRQQPPHVRVAELRHDSGDARRDVELRRVAGTRHGRQHLVDDARGHEPDARHGELSGTGPTRSIRGTRSRSWRSRSVPRPASCTTPATRTTSRSRSAARSCFRRS